MKVPAVGKNLVPSYRLLGLRFPNWVLTTKAALIVEERSGGVRILRV